MAKAKAATAAKAAKKGSAPTYVFAFGARTDGNASMRNTLGGKGANLAEMAILSLPVPPGFTLSTEVCTAFYANGGTYPGGLEATVARAVAEVEAQQGKRFGDAANPLLFSVRGYKYSTHSSTVTNTILNSCNCKYNNL